MFQRLHSSSKYEGHGIGLAYCKKIIEMHQGEIWVESILGNGANFLFTLPENREV
jgi:chemotaxis family two-component system sensor kinase Cph1